MARRSRMAPDRLAEMWRADVPLKEIAAALGVGESSVSRAAKRLGLAPRSIQSRRDVADPRCAVPGCGRLLQGAAPSGVCRRHFHEPGYCRCSRCRPDLAAMLERPPRRPAATYAEIAATAAAKGITIVQALAAYHRARAAARGTGPA